jgi:hypothetical protein
MDPLTALRGEVPYLDPLERGRLHGLAEDARWQGEEEQRRADAAARCEHDLMAREAAERTQIARQGYSDRELAEWRQAEETRKRERVAELTDELRRLRGGPSPDVPVSRSARSWDSWSAQVLARSKALDRDEFMRQQIAGYNERRDAVRRADRQAEISRLERQVEADRQRTMTRVTGNAFDVY